MNPERLQTAIDILREIGENFVNMPEEREKAAQGWFTLCNAALYLTELSYHLGNGTDPYDAVLATIRGEMLIPVTAGASTATIREGRE